MDYVLLIHAAESRFAQMSPADGAALSQGYASYTRDIHATGRAGDGAGLDPTTTATSVKVRDGKRAVTDGPYAETREQLGGYYVFSAKDEQEALDWAAKIPDANGGAIEVRPVMAMPPSASQPPATKATPPAGAKEYVLLIYGNEAEGGKMTEAQRGEMFGRYYSLNEWLKAEGKMVAGAPLQASTTSKVVRVSGGKRTVTDGPYAETREQLGGYYRVWAANIDEAMAIAAKIPGAEVGTIEVRPVMDTSKYM